MVLERLSLKTLRIACLFSILLGISMQFSTAHAQSKSQGWRLCNETSFILEAATGRPEGGSSIVVEGWTRLRPGECRIAIPAPLREANYYVMARSSSAHHGGQRMWGGEIPLCVDTTGSFAVESPTSCIAMGLEERSFRAVKIENRNNWTTRLTETEPYGTKLSQNAGVQRLLKDAGVANTSIDGYVGRSTRGAIAAFLKANKLSKDTPDTTLIDILEEVANTRSREVGMTICNRTPHKLWTAIGRRRGNGWESRGWWTLDSDSCARTIDESLIPTPHYVFAEMETDEGMRRLKVASHLFCIARSKFAIVGREGCVVRAYKEAEFVETASPTDGKLIYEFFERDFEEEPSEDN